MPKRDSPIDSRPYDRLKSLMEAHKMRPSQLAKALDLSRSVLSRALATNTGLDRHWIKVAELFDESLDWILRGKSLHLGSEFKNKFRLKQDGVPRMTHLPFFVTGDSTQSPPQPAYQEVLTMIELTTDGSAIKIEKDASNPFLKHGGFLLLAGYSSLVEDELMDQLTPDDLVAIQLKSNEYVFGSMQLDQRHGHYVIHPFKNPESPQVIRKDEILFVKRISAIVPGRVS